MPSIERQGRLQTALLWNILGEDAQGESVLEHDPTEIVVRADLGKGTGGFNAIRSSLTVDREIKIGSIVKLDSTLDNWLGTSSADIAGEYLKVVAYHETPDLKNRNTRKTVRLELYRGTPPERD